MKYKRTALRSIPTFLLAVIIAISASIAPVRAAAATTLYLHSAGPENNPPVLFLDQTAPNTSFAKYKDSTAINFTGGNMWKEVGAWPSSQVGAGVLTELGDAHIWLGLKNSDDQGTRFDVRAEVLKNGVVIATGLQRCVAGVVRNANLAKEVAIPFGPSLPVTFNGTSDTLSLKIAARIGTDSNDAKCSGHNNAAGLRTYFDAVNRQARLDATIVPNTATGKAYVTNANGSANSVSVVDLATNAVMATIPVGASPRGVAYNPNTHRAYTANIESHDVSVINTMTDAVVETIPVAGDPIGITVSADGSRVYVSSFGPNGGVVSVIDAATNTVLATITGFADPHNTVVSADGTKLYIVNVNCCAVVNGFISVIDTTTYAIVDTIEVGVSPSNLVLTPDGQRLYVANDGGAYQGTTVSVINTATDTVIGTISVGVNPRGMAVNSTGTRVYVSSTLFWSTNGTAPGLLQTIDTSTNTVVASVTVGNIPNNIAVSSDDSRVYVANTGSSIEGNVLSVVDTASNTVVDTVTVGAGPWGVATSVL